jgi:hypothetical protein
MDDSRQTTGKGRWTTVDGRQATSDEPRSTVDGRWGMEDGRWSTGYKGKGQRSMVVRGRDCATAKGNEESLNPDQLKSSRFVARVRRQELSVSDSKDE